MAISLSNKGRVAIKQQAAWGTAQTSFATTDYLEIEAPFVPAFAREAIRMNTFRPGFTEAEIVAGSKAPTELTFRFPMHGVWKTDPSANPTAHPDSLIFKTCLGGSGSQGYTTALASGSTSSVVNITNGSASTNWQGYGLLVPHSSGNMFGWAKTVDTTASPDAVTMIGPMQYTPSSSGTIYGSVTAYLCNDAQLPLTFDYVGSDANTAFRFYDGLPTSVRIVIAAKQVPVVEVTMRFLNWENLGTGGAPADYVYGFPMLPATLGANGSWFHHDTEDFCAATANITITQELSEVECTGSSQGVSELVATNRNITIEIVRTVTDLSALSFPDVTGDSPGSIASPGGGGLNMTLSTTPGKAVSIMVPEVVILEQPTTQDLGGKIAVRHLLGCRPYSGDTGSTAPADTPFRIAFA